MIELQVTWVIRSLGESLGDDLLAEGDMLENLQSEQSDLHVEIKLQSEAEVRKGTGAPSLLFATHALRAGQEARTGIALILDDGRAAGAKQ